MIKKLQHTICILLLGGCFTSSFCQEVSLKASIDRNQILIGEPIQFIVEAVMPLGLDLQWRPADSIAHFEIIKSAQVDTVRNVTVKSYTWSLTLTSFDSGRWVIPSMPVEVDGKKYMTDSLAVTVSFTAFNPSQDYHDIKDIIDVKNPYTRYINWVIAAFTVLSLAALIYFLRKKTAAIIPAPGKAAFRLSPIEEAMQSLEQLRKLHLSGQSQVKQYYTGLNDTLRLFLLRKLDMPTMERTNDELIMQVKQLGFHNDFLILLAQCLRMSDAVKFAKYNPDVESNEQNWKIIKNSIELINDLEK